MSRVYSWSRNLSSPGQAGALNLASVNRRGARNSGAAHTRRRTLLQIHLMPQEENRRDFQERLCSRSPPDLFLTCRSDRSISEARSLSAATTRLTVALHPRLIAPEADSLAAAQMAFSVDINSPAEAWTTHKHHTGTPGKERRQECARGKAVR